MAPLHNGTDTDLLDRQFTAGEAAGFEEGSSRIGGELRAARERLGWSIDAVAEALRIKAGYLRAIEEGDIHNLPGPAYAVGFVRSYSQALGLDSNEALRRFRAERAEVNRKTELDFPAPVPTRGVPAGALVLVGVIIAIGGYVGWYHYSGRSVRRADTVAALPAHLEPLAPPATPKPATPKLAGVAPKSGSAQAAGATGAGTRIASALPPIDQNVSPSSAAAAVPPPVAAPSPLPSTAPAPSASTGAANAASLSAATQPVTPAAITAGHLSPAVDQVGQAPAGQAQPAPMVIQATADAWIEIKNAEGRVLYQTILHPGDKYTVPNQPQLTLTTGNAGGTEVVLSGTMIGPLKGHVLHNIPLDAQSLRAASGQAASGQAAGGQATLTTPAAQSAPATQ